MCQLVVIQAIAKAINTARVAEVETEQPWEEPEEGAEVKSSKEDSKNPKKAREGLFWDQDYADVEAISVLGAIERLGEELPPEENMEEDKSKAVEEINPAKLNEKLLVKVKRLDNEAELDDLDRALQDGINHQDERKQSELKETEKEVENTNWERITFQENLTRWEQQRKGWLM